jgi:hypothetical protein
MLVTLATITTIHTSQQDAAGDEQLASHAQ